MPLFEYACRGCGARFEAFVTPDRVASCPACHGAELDKLLSTPGMVAAAAAHRPAEALPGCRAQGGHCACAHDES
jgi:putative FmdB family regulatory protein